ncbi:methylated-DNA--[protein]-cysteine S-methyltransferase [Streptomyces sp. B6B3]|uniref:methylated-DNA--[protein]-cysteine S-methyltransferase n=1 Tax=Streptomyces sp. B6B3 TaxID=3153570 RepID=UPI00325CDBA0
MSASGRDWAWVVRDTPIGPLLLAATERGLVSVVFHADERTIRRSLGRLTAVLGPRPDRTEPDQTGADQTGAERTEPEGEGAEDVLRRAVAELDGYFRGELRAFATALDWSLVSGFTEQVLRELAASVPFGSVVGYGELAERVGEPDAARAVGAAMGANPLPVVVPCHRVVAADGGIGGFGGGLTTKRELLALEGVLPQPLF